ncbi:MAG: DEAD/DEAH box helicase [Betaproteobacteria bacterium]|nr:DEAD/DEAH box helicase [Betaproteobacteria bacterium]
MSFESLNLDPAILQALTASGYTEPTPVQARAIPEAIAGHDLMVSAPTGTGKTAVFVLPALQRLAQPSAKPGRGPRMLVLTPTRELALQVTTAVEKYSKFMPRVRTGTVLGGMPYPKQRRLLESPLDILVATPGRLIDFIDQGKVDFSRLELLVLDEADRMLDMGFIKPVERIAGATPAARQTMLFSATLDGGIATLAKRLLKQPKLIEVEATQANHDNIEQRLHYVDDGSHKHRLLDHLLRDVEIDQAIVFTATKRGADRLAGKLSDNGHAAAALHGNMNQSQRNRTLAKVRSGDVRVLVATDVAARGIDVLSITHVINYDLPKVAEDYVHRIGRTGRAGASGIAISFAAPDEAHQLKQIERYTGQQIDRHVVAGMEPKPQSRHGAPGGERKRYGEQGKPRSSNNGNTRWGGGKSYGGNGGRQSRDFGDRSRGRG